MTQCPVYSTYSPYSVFATKFQAGHNFFCRHCYYSGGFYPTKPCFDALKSRSLKFYYEEEHLVFLFPAIIFYKLINFSIPSWIRALTVFSTSFLTFPCTDWEFFPSRKANFKFALVPALEISLWTWGHYSIDFCCVLTAPASLFQCS